MGLFDLFSSSGGADAARGLQNVASNQRDAYNNMRADGLRGITNTLRGSMDRQLDIYNNVRPRVMQYLQGGFADARNDLQGASALYDPYRQQGLQAFSAMGDASGLNGAQGASRAQDAFRASPGYEYMRDQSLDAVQRSANAMGVLGSGNTMAALSDRAGNMADQEWDDYYGRLQGISDTGYNATTAQAGIAGAQAGLATQRGAALGGYLDSDAARRAGVIDQFGDGRANAILGLTGMGMQGLTASGQIAAQAPMLNYQAQNTANQNQFGGLTGLLNLGAQAAGSSLGQSWLQRLFGPTASGGSAAP